MANGDRDGMEFRAAAEKFYQSYKPRLTTVESDIPELLARAMRIAVEETDKEFGRAPTLPLMPQDLRSVAARIESRIGGDNPGARR